jgi:hypothetical protein
MCGGGKLSWLSVLFISQPHKFSFGDNWMLLRDRMLSGGGGHGLIGSYERGKGLRRDFGERKALALVVTFNLVGKAQKTEQTEWNEK